MYTIDYINLLDCLKLKVVIKFIPRLNLIKN